MRSSENTASKGCEKVSHNSWRREALRYLLDAGHAHNVYIAPVIDVIIVELPSSQELVAEFLDRQRTRGALKLSMLGDE